MRIALISDIHANLEALQTVLADIDRRIDTSKGDKIWSLGDIIGYGPNPVECADLVAKRCEWSLLGNHDFAALYEPTNFNMVAEKAAFWTRGQFEKEGASDQAGAMKRWEFLGKLRVRVSTGPFMCVHGTPRRPINEYLFPEDAVSSPGKMADIFKRIRKSGALYCLVGHTHVPGVFTEDGDFYRAVEIKNQTWEFKLNPRPRKPDETDPAEPAETAPSPERLIINPGSVGQPRDTDPRASYAIMDVEIVRDVDGTEQMKPRSVEFFRLEYDIAKTREKINLIAEELAESDVRKRNMNGRIRILDELPKRGDSSIAANGALEWLDRRIAELDAGVKTSGTDGKFEAFSRSDVEDLRTLRADCSQHSDFTTCDLRYFILDQEQQYRNDVEKYKWLGTRLTEGR